MLKCFSSTITALILIMSLNSLLAAATLPEFNFEKMLTKLVNFNQLAPCFAKIHKEFVQCNAEAAEKAKPYLDSLDPNTEFGRRVSCCGMWYLQDCWLEPAKSVCEPDQLAQIRELPYMFEPTMRERCHDIPPGSDKCKFPIWIIILVLLVLMSLVGCGVWCGMRCYRRRRGRHQKYRNAKNGTLHVEPTKEEIKPMKAGEHPV